MRTILNQSYNDYRKSIHTEAKFDLTGLVFGVQSRLHIFFSKGGASSAMRRWVYSDVLEILLIRTALQLCKSEEYPKLGTTEEKFDFLESKLLNYALIWLTEHHSTRTDYSLIQNLIKALQKFN